MLGQVVTAHEAAEAHGANELLLSCVGPSVARQLIRASKLPLTTLPLASEGLLTCCNTDSEVEIEDFAACTQEPLMSHLFKTSDYFYFCIRC